MRYYHVTNAYHLTFAMGALLSTKLFIGEGGLDIPRVLEQELRRSKEALLNAESEQNLAGGRSTVILFIPHRNIAFNNDDLTIARANFIHFRDFVPGQYPKIYQCSQVTCMVQLTNFSLPQTISST